MKVKVHLWPQSNPVLLDNIRNTYQKGDLFCALGENGKVTKFAIIHIFRIVEEDESSETETAADKIARAFAAAR